MALFAGRLRARGISDVHCHRWSGGHFRSFLPGTARGFARFLRTVSHADTTRSTTVPISILAKSSGALIAEAALRLLSAEGCNVSVETLLRVAPPDPRGNPAVPLTQRVVSVTSDADGHYKAGLMAWRLMQLHRWYRDDPADPRHITFLLKGFTHRDLNYPHYPAELGGVDLYDFYIDTLLGGTMRLA